MSLFILLGFDAVTLYVLIYSMIYISQRYKQVAITPDVFDDLTEMRDEQQVTTSDIIALALRSMKREMARRNGVAASNP